jgi:hypothetical protein
MTESWEAYESSMIGVKVALVGLSLPDRGRPPAEVGRGGLLADTGRDGPGLHANMTHLHSCGCRKHEKGWLHAVGVTHNTQPVSTVVQQSCLFVVMHLEVTVRNWDMVIGRWSLKIRVCNEQSS